MKTDMLMEKPNQYSIIAVDCNWTRFTAKLKEQFIFKHKFITTNFKRWLVENIYSQESTESQQINIPQQAYGPNYNFFSLQE